jgi:hypothetical protein
MTTCFASTSLEALLWPDKRTHKSTQAISVSTFKKIILYLIKLNRTAAMLIEWHQMRSYSLCNACPYVKEFRFYTLVLYFESFCRYVMCISMISALLAIVCKWGQDIHMVDFITKEQDMVTAWQANNAYWLLNTLWNSDFQSSLCFILASFPIYSEYEQSKGSLQPICTTESTSEKTEHT